MLLDFVSFLIVIIEYISLRIYKNIPIPEWNCLEWFRINLYVYQAIKLQNNINRQKYWIQITSFPDATVPDHTIQFI